MTFRLFEFLSPLVFLWTYNVNSVLKRKKNGLNILQLRKKVAFFFSETINRNESIYLYVCVESKTFKIILSVKIVNQCYQADRSKHNVNIPAQLWTDDALSGIRGHPGERVALIDGTLGCELNMLWPPWCKMLLI